MEWLKQWLLSVTCAALIAALADALCPSGFPKTLTRMAGGLLLLLAVLKPVAGLDEGVLRELYDPGAGRDAPVTAGQEEMINSIIARETAAYISDKAAALGIEDAKVSVECRMTPDGFPSPESVTVQGTGTDQAWQALQEAIAADFALAGDEQTLERMDVP